MSKLIRELRRREVFRTAGLYVGICWIIIEVSSVLIPAFELPDWILRALIIAAIVGFPIMLVLAWVYDISDKGIEVQADPTDTIVAPLGSRKTDFVVIGVLSVALVISVYLNFSGGPDVVVDPDPVSLLIADFDNQTGNALFDGALEQSLSLGIEGAAFVTAFARDSALKQVKSLSLGTSLNEESARLVAVRQDVSMVLAGAIVPKGDGFELSLRAVEPASGLVIAESDARAKGAPDVLGAVNELAADFRKELGEESRDLDQLLSGETVTAASLQAMKYYVTAQELAKQGKDEEAIRYYKLAVDDDENMARAYSGWALSAHKIGRPDEAEEQWQKALSLLDRMTQRERYRTFGLYYTVVSLNYDKAIENYQQLVDEFPADGAGNNNLAILYTFTAQYERALKQSEQLLTIYPGRVLYHANHSQYAMYAGEMDTALREAEYVLEQDAGFFKSYMIQSIVSLHDRDPLSARLYYDRMAETGVRGQSLASVGLADIDIFEGRYEEALLRLRPAIELDKSEQINRGVTTKSVAMAQSLAALGRNAEAISLLDSIERRRDDGFLVPAAELYAAAGEFGKANEIADAYRTQFRPTARAYASLIDGINAYHQSEYVIAIDALQKAVGAADLWIVRYYLGRAYLAGGYPAEAISEFEACIARRSETGGLFFDDVPTWRYTASLEERKREASNAFGNLAASAN